MLRIVAGAALLGLAHGAGKCVNRDGATWEVVTQPQSCTETTSVALDFAGCAAVGVGDDNLDRATECDAVRKVDGSRACTYTVAEGDGTCAETASVAADRTACLAVTDSALDDATACEAVMTDADNQVPACTYDMGCANAGD